MQALSVTVRNVTGPSLATVLDVVVGSGSDITSIGSLQLKFSDALTNQLTDQARRAAVANVMATAELYSGVSTLLVPIVICMSSSLQSLIRPMMNACAEGQDQTWSWSGHSLSCLVGCQHVSRQCKQSLTALHNCHSSGRSAFSWPWSLQPIAMSSPPAASPCKYTDCAGAQLTSGPTDQL